MHENMHYVVYIEIINALLVLLGKPLIVVGVLSSGFSTSANVVWLYEVSKSFSIVKSEFGEKCWYGLE